MSTATLKLHFDSMGSPYLREGEFYFDKPAQHQPYVGPLSRFNEALQAFCILSLETKLGRPKLGGKVYERMRYVTTEGGKTDPGAHWLKELFDDHKILSRLVQFETDKRPPVWLSDAVLRPQDITVTWNAEELQTPTQQQRLLSALWERFLGGDIEDDADNEIELLKAKLQSLAVEEVSLAVEITRSEQELPLAAADVLLAKLIECAGARRCGRAVTVALSGGLLQAFVVDEVRNCYRRRHLRPHTAVQVIALNRMNFNDFYRYDRGADFLAFEFAKAVSHDPEISLPPISDAGGLTAPYDEALSRCDILLVSGGAKSSDSFISSFLGIHNDKMPDSAVGDLIGHLISASGQDAADEQRRRILEPLKCRPSLNELAAMARDKKKYIILLVDAIPGRSEDTPSKAPLVLAALRGGLANHLIISKHLAGEVVQLGIR